MGMVVGVGLGITLVFRPILSLAAPAREIPFSARLKNFSGDSVVPDATYSLTFSLYTTDSGGTPVWSETQSLQVTNGVVSTTLGTVAPIPQSLAFNDLYYLGVKVGTDAEMTPRRKVSAVPLALNSTMLDGRSVGTEANNVLALNASGNLSIAGSLQGGSASITGALSAGATSLSSLTVSGAANFLGSFSLGSSLSVAQGGIFGGPLTIGGNLIPAVTGSYDLGTSSNHFANAYIDNLITNNASTSGTANTSFTINDQATGDADSSLNFYRGGTLTAAQILWDSTHQYLALNQPLHVAGSGTFTEGLTATSINSLSLGASAGSFSGALLTNTNIGVNAGIGAGWGGNTSLGYGAGALEYYLGNATSIGAEANAGQSAVALGWGALANSYSVAIGLGTRTGVKAGDFGVAIGPLSTAGVNAVAIGNQVSAADNEVVLGNNSTVRTLLAGNIGIGTTTPGVKLDVSLTTGTGSATRISNDVSGDGVMKDYTLKVLSTSPNSNGANRGLYVEASSASANQALTVVGTSHFTGDMSVIGNMAMQGVPSATLGNLLIGDATPNFAAGHGGVLGFSGDTVGQVGDGNRSVFASLQGIKENSSYTNSLGALIFSTQSSSADVATLTTTTEKMRITSDGKVGIGTSSPGYKLDVAGDANITGTYRINGVPISATSNWTQSGDDIYYSTGNVGIGTSTPTSKLTLEGGAGPGIELRRTGQSSWRVQNTNNGFAVQNDLTNTGTYSRSPITAMDGTDATLKLMWGTAYGTDPVISLGGDVGIGTASPAGALHVVGSNYLTSFLQAPQFPAQVFRSGSTDFGFIGSGHVTNGGATDLGIRSTGKLQLAGGNTDAALTVYSGRVGIGTDTPAVPLHVLSVTTAAAMFDSSSSSGSPIAVFSVQGTQFGAIGSAAGMLTGAAQTDLGLSANNIALATGGNTAANIRLYVAQGGNVGIGTTSPTASLQVLNAYDRTLAKFGPGIALTSTNGGQAYFGSQLWGYDGSSWTRNNGVGAAMFGSASGGNFQVWTTAAGDLQSTAPSDSNARLTVLNNGNVGIGTASPSFPLEVSSAVSAGQAAARFKSSVNNGRIDLQPNNGAIEVGVPGNYFTALQFGARKLDIIDTGISGQTMLSVDNGTLRTNSITSGGVNGLTYSPLTLTSSYFGTSTVTPAINFTTYDDGGSTDLSSKMQIFNGDSGKIILQPSGIGNVGIGTASPGYKLEVSSAASTMLALKNSSAVATGNSAGMAFVANTTELGEVLGYAEGPGGSYGALQFLTRNNGAPDEKMRITSGGNVGIGTISPQAMLSVDTTNASYPLGLYVNQSSNSQPAARFSNSGGSGTTLELLGSDGYGDYFRDNGRLGINTATPSQALDVQGAIRLGANTNTNNILDTYAAPGAASGSLYWGNSPLVTTADLTTYGVASVNGVAGIMSIANASGSGSTVTINSAAADGSTKGIASFNATNFSASGGVVNTIQGIATSSSPTFAGQTINGNSAFVSEGAVGSLVSIGQADGGGSPKQLVISTNPTNNFIAFQGIQQNVGFNQNIVFQQSGGNVGIGTTIPGAKLEVSGNARITGPTQIGSPGSGAYLQVFSTPSDTGGGEGMYITKTGTTSATALLQLGALDGNDRAPLDFYVFNGGYNRVLRLAPSGNVGIGNDSPSAKLHVVGSADTQQLIVKANATQTANIQEWQSSTGAVKALVNANGDFSRMGNGGSGSEQFGTGADAAGSNSVAIGNSSHAQGNGSIAIGMGAEVNAAAYANGSIAIGFGATVGDHWASIALGRSSATTADGQFVIGGGSYQVKDIYPSGLIQSASDVVTYHSPSGGGGFNIKGWDLMMQPGTGTGTGGGGDFIIQTAAAGASSNIPLPYSERLRVTSAGNVGIDTATPTAKLQVKGTGASSATTSLSIQNSASTDLLAVRDDGTIGIGTATPATTLDVRGGGTPAITVGNLANTDGALYFGNSSHGIKRNYNGGANDVGFYTTGDLYLSGNGILSNQFVLQRFGNIGVGTAGPDRKLDVLDAANPQLRLTQADGSVYTDMQTTASGYLYLNPSGGRIGIGTNSPDSKLEVTGNADVQQFIVKANAAQTANITEVQDANGNVLVSIDKNGTLKASNTKTAITTTDKTSDYTLTDSDSIVTADSSGGAVTLTLPTAVGRTGQQFTLKKVDSSGTAVTVGTTSGQTVDGSTSYNLSSQWSTVIVVSNGSNWLIVGKF